MVTRRSGHNATLLPDGKVLVAGARLHATNQARLDALPAWLDFYNGERSHCSVGGQSPMIVMVNNVSGNRS